jgi:hypothetical protein
VTTSPNDKENLIRKLLEEGHTYRYITKFVHCSPNDIAPISRKIAGENTEANTDMKSKSQCSQALYLLQKGVPLIDVIILLDIDPDQGKKYHDIYLYLIKREKIVSLLKDGKDMDIKIEIFEYLKENPPQLRRIRENENTHIEVWVDSPWVEIDADTDK